MIMPLVAVSLVAIFAVAGLALDAGQAYLSRSEIQNAADAAALAAAQEIKANGSGNATAAATQTAAANGFTNGVNNVTVTFANPPGGSSPHASDGRFTRVTITRTLPTNLMAIVGLNSLTVSGSAVGGPSTQLLPLPCLLVTPGNPNDQGVDISGSAQLVAAGCPIAVKSNYSKAIKLSGSSDVSVTGPDAKVVIGKFGGWSASGSSSITPTPTTKPLTDDVFTDPFGTLPPPTPGACVSPLPSGFTRTYSPGTYCSDIKLTGSTNATFLPGIYILNNVAMKATGSSSLSGSGVFFYLAGDNANFDLSGSGSLTLSAPTSGTYKGMLFWQTSSEDAHLSGSSAMTLQGNLYLPNAKLDFSGSSSSNQVGAIVAGFLDMSGSSNVNLHAYPIAADYWPTGGSGSVVLFE